MVDDPTHGGTIVSAYDRWAATYDADRNLTRDLDAMVVREAGLHIAGRDILEAGCGTGKNTVWLAAHARAITALDFSAGMIAQARTRVPAAHVTFVEHDLREPWPAASASFDCVIVDLVLEHVADLAPVFAEAARVLRPGGQLFVCELHPERQRKGGQAQFVDRATGQPVHVAAFRHTIPEFVNGGIAAGLTVRRLGEHVEADAPADAGPRLVSFLFERRDDPPARTG